MKTIDGIEFTEAEVEKAIIDLKRSIEHDRSNIIKDNFFYWFFIIQCNSSPSANNI